MKLLTCLTKPFVLFVLLFALGVGDVWGGDLYTLDYPYFYYYNDDDNWDKCLVLYGRNYDSEWDHNTPGHYTKAQNMTSVSGTKLYYKYIDDGKWDKSYNEIAVLKAKKEGSSWGDERQKIETRWGGCEHTTNRVTNYNLNYHRTYLWDGKAASTILTINDQNTENGYTSLNHSQTIKKYTCGDGESSYSAASVNSGTVTISAYKMTAHGAASEIGNSATLDEASETSASKDAAYTGEVTVTASANTGYVFMGWYSSENGGTEDKLSSSSSYTYNAPNSTKTVYARFAEKLPVGKTLYLATNAKWRENSARFAAVFCNASIQQWENCSAVAGTDDMYSVSIPDGNWGCVIFCKMKNGSDEERVNKWENRWCQTDDMYKTGLNNCVYITGDCSNDQRWGKYAQIPAIVGGMNNWDPVANQFSGSPLRLTMDLSAGQAYQFKLASGRDDYWYGHGASNNNDLTFAGQTNAETLSQGHRNMMFLTARAGTYTFEWDATNSKLTIIYPDTLHPSMDYVYMEKYSGWNSGNFSNIHYWDDSSNPLTAGSDDPKMTAYHNFKDKSLNYYIYPMLTDYPNFKAADGLNGGTNHTDNMVATGHGGHYTYWGGSSWVWSTFQVYIKLENQGADEGKKGTLGVPVAFNDTALVTRISKPVKTNYDFGGYYTAAEGGGALIIDENGDWQTNVSDYTADGVWIHAGDTTTLYALWTETARTITLQTSPSGTGSFNVGGETKTAGETITAYYETPTPVIRADSVHPAWKFKGWDYSTNVGPVAGTGTPGSRTVQIKATQDGTLTAKFEPRYCLVGSLPGDNPQNGGMPGWDNYTADFTVQSTSPSINLTCTCTLQPNTQYKFQVHDRLYNNGTNYGYDPAGTTLPNGQSFLLDDANDDVYFKTYGRGIYVFKITDMTANSGQYFPTVTIERQSSWQVNLGAGYKDIDGTIHSNTTAGGTISATATENAIDTPIVNEQYIADGGTLSYSNSPNAGYKFKGWYSASNYSGDPFNWSSFTVNSAANVYALFTEDTIDVTIANDGHGTVQIGGETVTAAKVGVITTRTITAVAHPGYKFSHWTVPDGKNFNVASTTSATTTLSGLGTGSAGTLTANFEPRYELRGSDMNGVDTSVGMPGWTTGTPLTGTTSIEPSGSEDIPVNLTCTCTLHPNKEYKFSIHDRTPNRNYGPSSNLSLLNSGDDMLLNTENNNVKIVTVGYGTYIFKITKLSRTNYYPTVTVERQASHTLTLGKNIDAGGGVSAQTNEGGGGGFAITNGQFFATGSDITFTASPSAGYYVAGWYSDAECTTPYNGEDDGVTIGEYNLTLTLSGISTNKTVYAKFAKIWSVYLNSEHTYWSTYAKTDGDDIYTFNIDLPANTQYTFTIKDNGAGSVYKIANNYYMEYGNSSNWGGFGTDKTYDCGIKTAGKGTYTFIWNATDKVLSVNYPTSYTVTFGYGTGGSAVTATVEDATTITTGQYATSGKDITFTKTAATGYTFKGWYDAASGGSAISCMASDDVYDDIGGNINVYAQYTANTYTVRYNANDASYYGSASGTTASSSHTYDEAKSLTSNGFSFTGYTFDSWNTAEDGSGYSYTDGQSVSNLSSTQGETVDLYAIWTANTYTITLKPNGGSGDDQSVTATYGAKARGNADTFTGITNPTRTGYNFGGWYTNSDGTGTQIITQWFYYDWNTDYVDNAGKWKHDGNVTAYAKWTPVALTFTGATDSDWNTASNWSPACVPTIDHDVVITKPVTVDIAHATAKSIVLDQNSHTGKLTIQANKGLEVAGTITRTTDGSNRLATREEDLVLESSTAGNASLIFNNSNACRATVMMYSKASISGDTWNWQYVGTPFTGSIPQYNYYGSWMYKWNGGWEVVHGGDELTPFAGYCLTQNSATTHVMGGTLVPTTSKSVEMAASTDMVLANSWTAPISIASFDIEGGDATFTSTPATVYLFNTGMAEDGSVEGTEAGTYISVPINSAPYTGNGLIAPMQGFFVTTYNGAAGSITMNYDALVRPAGSHTDIVAGPMYAKKQEIKPEVMKIRANGTQYSDRVVILAREDFSEGFDNGWDGEKLSFGAEAPSVYVINQEGGYDAVSAIPGFEGTLVGFRAGTNNSCTMSFEYDGDETLYLNDLQAQMSTLISEENNYTFTTSAGDSEVRFIISATPIQKVPTGIGNDANDANDAMVKVRKLIINDHVYIIRSGRMYGVDGQMIK